jgi:hypothetical protein
VTIEPGSDFAGQLLVTKLRDFHPDYASDERTERATHREIEITLAGDVAESIRSKRKYRLPDFLGTDDWNKAASLAANLHGSYETTDAYLRYLWCGTTDMLSLPLNWKQVQALAGALLKERTIGWRKARKIMEAARDQAVFGSLPDVTEGS